MIYRELGVAGAWRIEPERAEDERGFFARTFCRREFAERGLEAAVAQASVSFNRRRGTLRGLHFQAPPHEEAKLVRVTRGAIFDVVVDLRPASPTYLRHAAEILSAEDGHEVYVPRGCAHGFQTLEDATEISYLISTPYAPQAVRGYRYDDPAFDIAWPLPVSVISERDRGLPYLTAEAERKGEPEG